MYNSDIPTRAELPTSRQLIKSTVIAIVAALAILVTIVMPSEYAIDPTGVGKMLNLTEMGEIKLQLQEEAEKDRALTAPATAPADQSGNLLNSLTGLFVSKAHAQEAAKTWKEEFSYVLKPDQSIEVKLVMEKDAEAEFKWSAGGGKVNFDLHGDNGTENISYKKGRGIEGAEGVLKAAFTGNHGWFWRNRGDAEITIKLQVNGAYSGVVQPK